MVRVIRVYCPRCERDYETVVTDDYLRAARESATGVTGIVDIHDDHALIIFVDAQGHERGVRVYTLLPRSIGVAQRLSIPERYLEDLERIVSIVLKLSSRGLIIEGSKGSSFFALKVSEGEDELELSLGSSGDVKKIGEWSRAFLLGVARGAEMARLDTLLLSLRILDACLDRTPPSYAHQVFKLIVASRNITIRLNEEESELFETYISRIADVYPRHHLVYVLRSSGSTFYEAIRDRDPLTVYELADCALALKRRGVIELEETS